jgi:hypothetical protein
MAHAPDPAISQSKAGGPLKDKGFRSVLQGMGEACLMLKKLTENRL